MTGETTPILSGTIPAFQSLQDRWQDHARKHPDVSKYVVEGMTWLNKYHEKAGRTRAYVIAMGEWYSLCLTLTAELTITFPLSSKSKYQNVLYPETVVTDGNGRCSEMD
jgi:hypothetical protein